MKSFTFGRVEWLMAWYQSNCDGDWEHYYGIEIGTLDNPGWYVKIDLDETAKSGTVIPRKSIERTDSNWISIEVKDNGFEAYGGPGNLSEMIDMFAAFVEDRLKLE